MPSRTQTIFCLRTKTNMVDTLFPLNIPGCAVLEQELGLLHRNKLSISGRTFSPRQTRGKESFSGIEPATSGFSPRTLPLSPSLIYSIVDTFVAFHCAGIEPVTS